MHPRRIMMLMGVVKRWRIFKNEHRQICENYKSDAEGDTYDEEQRSYKYQHFCRRRRGD